MDFSDLNFEQQNVVLHADGPCLVLAGAGSGKTRTIVHRVAHLLSQGVKPEELLLVTFTNKAAREMMDRVQALLDGDARLPWAGTFHHVAYKILKQYAPLLGYRSNFTILDSADSADLLKLCVKQEGVDRNSRRFPSANVIQSIVSFARNAETTIADVLDLKHPQWIDIAETVGRIADEYHKRKRDANAMDFDDLLVNLYLLLLKSESTRKRFASQFRYVLVDEYQDTNKIQASIIRLFASMHNNILVVGDDAQSIYSFRAADIQNILDYSTKGACLSGRQGSASGGEGYPDAKIFYLTTNYRSTPEILRVANDVIAQNKKQYAKELQSVRPAFIKPEVRAFVDEFEEGEWIADRILELVDEGVPLPHIAVLFRAAFHSQALEVELVKRNIPYDYRGGVRFFERAHIKDVLAFLRVFANKDDVIAWSRVLTMQVGIGAAGAEKVIQNIRLLPYEEPLPNHPPAKGGQVRGEGDAISFEHIGSVLSARGQVGWADFLSVWRAMQKTTGTPAELIRAVIGSRYKEYVETEYPDYRERLQDIEQLALFSERSKDLSTFLAEASMQESYQAAAAKGGDDEEKMVLSTIHQAKGLEWEAVFVIGLSGGKFPHERSLREPDGLEEERRLFYVAITRAKRHLHLSYAIAGGFNVLGGPSMFLDDIDQDLVDLHHIDTDLSIWSDPSDVEDDVVYVPEDGWEKNKKSFLKDIGEL